MDEYNSKLITLFYEVNIRQDGEELEDSCETFEDYLKFVREVYPDIINDYSCSFMATHSPCNNDHLPEGVENYMHSLVFDKNLGLLLCCSFRIKTDLLYNKDGWHYDTEKLKSILFQIDDKMDGALMDGWGENGMQAETIKGDIDLDFRSHIKKIVIDIPNTCWLHAKWKNIDAIKHFDWIMDGIAIYHALYRPEIVENTIKAKEKFINEITQKLEESSEVPQQAVDTIKEEIKSPFDEDIQIYEYVKENKDMFFTA